VRSETFLKISVGAFVAAFFAYLFGPLIIMSLTAFNSSQFPRVTPWECFSVEWFDVLINDAKLMNGLRNSLVIGFGVILIAVPMGLSPILVPGVVLGISTLIFWDRMGRMFNAGYDSIFYDGIFLTILGQATFISAYAMLVFIARLQRFDPAQEEAALDLGATHVQTFRRILLPFMKPAIGSAAVLAFLASFENYNTTVFTILSEETLTTVLASKVRYGINPSISALAVIIVSLTLVGAVVYEILKRREQAAEREAELVARGKVERRTKQTPLFLDPAMIVAVLVFIAGTGTVYFAGTIGLEECKAAVLAEKRAKTERAIKERQTKEMFRQAAPTTPDPYSPAVEEAPKVEAKGTEGYRSIFAPSTLEGMAGQESEEQKENVEAKGTEGYRSIFDPGNLKGQAGTEEKKP
jgi:spermidine/putrescine transport system permease protein